MGGAGEVCRSKGLGMGGVGRAGEDMARQQKERVAGEGEMRGRYGAGGVARGMAQAGKMRLRNLFGRFFSYTLGYVICQFFL